MKAVFVDTSFWIARFDKNDQLHGRAIQAVERLGNGIRFVTTDAVLTEFMNYFSKTSPELRQRTAEFVKSVVLLKLCFTDTATSSRE
jgi:predicted nucleic acid-binding protein